MRLLRTYVLLHYTRRAAGSYDPSVEHRIPCTEQEFLGEEGHTIGLHIRHDNGTTIGSARYRHSFGDSIARCERAVRVAQDEVGKHAQVLLCTDSLEVESLVRRRIPGALAGITNWQRLM